MKLHTGDTVVVITGKDKGKTGTIMRVMEAEGRIVVSAVNMRTKHIKKTTQEAGRIIHFEASLHASNVMLIDPKTKKRSRVGYKVDEKGNKLRISKKSGEKVVHVRAAKTPKKVTKVTDVADGTNVKKTKGTSVTPDTSATSVTPKKQPFWRRKGGPEVQEGDVAEGSRMTQDHSVPEQQTHVRGGSRGS